MILGEHGNGFEAWQVSEGQTSSRWRSVDYTDLLIYAFPRSKVG